MNRKSLILFIIITMFCVVVNGNNSEAKKAKPKLNKTRLSLTVEGDKEIKLKNAKKKVTWKCSNKKVVSIDTYGKRNSTCWINALKAGRATITAKSAGKKYKCMVKVKNKNTKPKSSGNKNNANNNTANSNTILANYRKLRDYISTYGAYNRNDNKFIKTTYENATAVIIVTDDNRLEFMISFTTTDEDDEVESESYLSIYISESDVTKGVGEFDIFLEDGDASAKWNGELCEIDSEPCLNWICASEGSDSIVSLANILLKGGYLMWSQLLDENLSMKLTDIGFSI